MSNLRAQMQQELIQHQQALADARKQHEMMLQAEQEKQEQQLMMQRAEHEASMQEEKDHHEHNLCLLIEQASAAKAEAERVSKPAPTPKDAPCAPPKPDAHDVKAKLRAKMESQTPGPQTGQLALPKPSVAPPAPVVLDTPTQQAPPPTTRPPCTQHAVQTNSPPAQTQLAVQTSSPPAQTQLALQTNPAAQTALQGIGSGPFNSSTHPAAWGALYRITKAPDCMPEIRQAWDAGVLCCRSLWYTSGAWHVHTHIHTYSHTVLYAHTETYIHAPAYDSCASLVDPCATKPLLNLIALLVVHPCIYLLFIYTYIKPYRTCFSGYLLS